MIMPLVDLTKIEKLYHRAIMEMLIDSNKALLMCPPYNASIRNKLIHNEILKLLKRDNRWCVPIHSAWNMQLVEVSVFQRNPAREKHLQRFRAVSREDAALL